MGQNTRRAVDENDSIVEESRILAFAAAVFRTVDTFASVDFSSDVDDEFDAPSAVRARNPLPGRNGGVAVPEPEEPQ
jgi:hypothetical protein